MNCSKCPIYDYDLCDLVCAYQIWEKVDAILGEPNAVVGQAGTQVNLLSVSPTSAHEIARLGNDGQAGSTQPGNLVRRRWADMRLG
jgi:hypothetical protein